MTTDLFLLQLLVNYLNSYYYKGLTFSSQHVPTNLYLKYEIIIFLLKELFRHYITNGSYMHATMLDGFKAFDKVNQSYIC